MGFFLGFEISDVLAINDKDYTITFALYFSAEWMEPRLNLRKASQIQTYLLHAPIPPHPPWVAMSSVKRTFGPFGNLHQKMVDSKIQQFISKDGVDIKNVFE